MSTTQPSPTSSPYARDVATFEKISEAISQNLVQLQKPGVLCARPGYRETGGYLSTEPAVVVTVANKRDVPASLSLPATIDRFPVDVRQASVLERIQAEDPGRYAQLVATGRPEYPLPAFDGERIVSTGALAAAAFDAVLAARPVKEHDTYEAPDVPLDAVTGPMAILCHVSPDAGWQELKRFFGQIRSKLTVGLYDFTSAHILDELKARLTATAADFSLVLDDPKKNPTADQTDPETVSALQNALRSNFHEAWALVRSSPEVNRWIFPTAYHIKVAVSDSKRFWLSSGNWNNSNQPDIDPWTDRAAADKVAKNSDRDWHVIVDHPGLAAVFEAYIQNDFAVASGPGIAAPDAADLFMDEAQLTDAELQAMAQEMLLSAKAPVSYFEPLRVPAAGTQSMTVQPLLTPDSGCYTGHVLDLIRSATTSFYMQTQYIHPSTKPEDQHFSELIDAVIKLQRSKVDVRLILSQWQKQQGWLDRLIQTGVDPASVRIQTGVHNKGIVVDSKVAMVSSENWSGDGILRNRDAGLIIHNEEAARYYEKIFLHDWENLAVPVTQPAAAAAPLSLDIPFAAPALALRSMQSTAKTRFVMANRRAGKFGAAKQVSRLAMDRVLSMIEPGVDLVADNQPADASARRVVVFDAEPAEVYSKVTDPNVIVEPEILHWTATIPPVDLIPAARRFASPPPLPATATAAITVTGAGQPLAFATVILYVRDLDGSKQMQTLTDAAGHAEFTTANTAALSAYVVIPAGNFWTMVRRGPSSDEKIDCPPLPISGALEWWHNLLGITAYDPALGKDINVGVIDTGCGPHGYLAHVTDVGSFIGGKTAPPPDGRDVDSHGTHVCGIIGARPTGLGFAGVAPGASLFCARVFPGPEQAANQGDIANAIDALSSASSVHIINMSLGSTQASQIEHDSITDAYERGTLCVCAAGNDAGAVNWPAQFPECVAVSALGVIGWGPNGTLAATRLPTIAERFGRDGYYLANFSSYGPQLLCAGPGVGIISTVPERHGLTTPYLAMDGTSMASPAVAGALAALLSKCAAYRTLPPDKSRADFAKAILRQYCQDVGLALQYQGLGVPKVPIGDVTLSKV
jgi:hypothetical protein